MVWAYVALYMISCGIIFAIFRGNRHNDTELNVFLGVGCLFWPIWIWVWAGSKAASYAITVLPHKKD